MRKLACFLIASKYIITQKSQKQKMTQKEKATVSHNERWLLFINLIYWLPTSNYTLIAYYQNH